MICNTIIRDRFSQKPGGKSPAGASLCNYPQFTVKPSSAPSSVALGLETSMLPRHQPESSARRDKARDLANRKRASRGAVLFSLLLGACLAVSSCASIDTGRLRSNARLPSDLKERSEPDAFAEPVHLPVSVAFYLYPTGDSVSRWTAKDQGRIVRWNEKQEGGNIVAEMLPMSTLSATGSSIAELRESAARYNARLLLVVKASGAEDEGLNPLAIFYPTLIGYLLAPGSYAEARVEVHGALIDILTGQVHSNFSFSETGRVWGPGAFLDAGEARAEVKKAILKGLSRRFRRALRDLPATWAPRRTSLEERLYDTFNSRQENAGSSLPPATTGDGESPGKIHLPEESLQEGRKNPVESPEAERAIRRSQIRILRNEDIGTQTGRKQSRSRIYRHRGEAGSENRQKRSNETDDSPSR